jgi:hypothetical protein
MGVRFIVVCVEKEVVEPVRACYHAYEQVPRPILQQRDHNFFVNVQGLKKILY